MNKPAPVEGGAPAAAPVTGPDDLDGVERCHVADVLRRHEGNNVQPAKAPGASRQTLHRLIGKDRIDDGAADDRAS